MARTTPRVCSVAVGPGRGGDEGHLARVVDLGQARQLAALHGAPAVEHAHAHVLGSRCCRNSRCCASSSGRIGRSVRCGPLPFDASLQLGRVGADGEVQRTSRRCALRRMRASSAIAPSKLTISGLMSSSANLGHVGQQLRHRHQHGVQTALRPAAGVSRQPPAAWPRGCVPPARGPAVRSAAAGRWRGRPSPRPPCRPGRTGSPGQTPGRCWRRRSALAHACARTMACTVKPSTAPAGVALDARQHGARRRRARRRRCRAGSAPRHRHRTCARCLRQDLEHHRESRSRGRLRPRPRRLGGTVRVSTTGCGRPRSTALASGSVSISRPLASACDRARTAAVGGAVGLQRLAGGASISSAWLRR
jgi:hypothetical protein